MIQWDINVIYPLVMTNSSPCFFDGPFIEIGGLPNLKMGGELLVITRWYCTWIYKWAIYTMAMLVITRGYMTLISH